MTERLPPIIDDADAQCVRRWPASLRWAATSRISCSPLRLIEAGLDDFFAAATNRGSFHWQMVERARAETAKDE